MGRKLPFRKPLFLLFLVLSSAFAEANHMILCGGPALRKWEDLRIKPDRHDQWWANFIRASTIRIDELRRVYGEGASVTWIVYKPGYVLRGKEDRKPYVTWITEQAQKRNVKLKWVSSSQQTMSAINSAPSRSVKTFDYFGHSNKHCFMLDYGCSIMGASTAWLHERDCRKIRRSIFAQDAICRSYGCHTAKSMSVYWNNALGIVLYGALGKTDYSGVGRGDLPKIAGR